MPLDRLPNLSALRVFEVVARSKSLVAAAAELNVTHGAVSKQIKALERDLGVDLFERRNRGIHPTQDGLWLAERLSVLFGDLNRTMRDFHDRVAAPSPMTVSCEPTLCLRFLIPNMTSLKRDTGLEVRVLAAGGPIDFRPGHVDVAIRRSDFEVPSDIHATPLAEECMGPVLQSSLATNAPTKLSRLHSNTRPNAWKDWMLASGLNLGDGDIHYEHFYLALQAAEAGLGIALASVHMVASELAAGRLTAPYGFIADGTHYRALRPATKKDERVERLIGWLEHRMAQSVQAVA